MAQQGEQAAQRQRNGKWMSHERIQLSQERKRIQFAKPAGAPLKKFAPHLWPP
jgi:hypothetical protein